MKWVVQSNFGEESNIRNFLEALNAFGCDVETFEYLSHSDTLPPYQDYPIGQTFLYGSTRIIELASVHPQWKDAVFFDIEKFSYEAWATHYGSHLLNDPSQSKLMTMQEFVNRSHEFAK